MNDDMIEKILACMTISDGHADIQRIQTRHRLELARFWEIEPGDRILEAGCGQGDTTAALAWLVGESGFVHAVDIASPDYGSPVTLGESAANLKSSIPGKRIKIEFGVDILSPGVDFPENSFDAIVLSHCSWYFASQAELAGIFEKTRKWGRKLCYAEWDPRIKAIGQLPHLLAVLVQAQLECFDKEGRRNVRTLFTPGDVGRIARDSGWKICREDSIHSAGLQDGRWETASILKEYRDGSAGAAFRAASGMPEKMATLMQSEMYLLEESTGIDEPVPMSTYAFVAE